MSSSAGAGAPAPKTVLRTRMRAIRRSIDDADGPRRSVIVCGRLRELVADRFELTPPPVLRRGVVMVFTPIRGEPQLDEFVDWCRSVGLATVVPEDHPDPDRVDVVVVPGLAFTAEGHRLGQGGGWYDRFLVRVPSWVLTIGVGFAEQVVDDLPVEPHDIPLDVIVTERDVWRRGIARSPTLPA